jgi:hypothetical protein
VGKAPIHVYAITISILMMDFYEFYALV